MPLPGNITTITVTGTYTDQLGNLLAGTVVFSTGLTLVDAAGRTVLGPAPIIVPLVGGSFSVVLPCTDNANLNPTGFSYTVTEQLAFGARTYTIQLPASLGTTVDISTLIPVNPAPPVSTVYGVLAQPNTWTATNTFTVPVILPGNPTANLQAATKQYVDQQTAGGTPDATTTTKGKVQLAGDLSGTAASPTVPALANKVSTTRQILTGTGLSGGGDLSADRTLTATDATTGAKGIVQLATDLGGTAAAPQVVGTHLAAALPVAQGGTGATTQNFVDLTTAQTAAGVKTFTSSPVVPTPTASGQAATKGYVDSVAGGPSFPLSGYGLLVAADAPALFQNVSGLSSGTVFGARCWVPANTALSNLAAAVRTGGTYSSSSVPNRLGIYDDTGALLQATTDDSTLWTTAGWTSRSITTVAAQASGRFVYILYICGGFSGVNVPYAVGASDTNAPWLGLAVTNSGNRRAFYLNGQSALPASFTPSSVGTNTGFIPLVGAY